MFENLPPQIRGAAFGTLMIARQTQPDGWPVPSIVERHAVAWQVPPEMLGAFFGLLRYRGQGRGRPWAWLDVFRGQHPDLPASLALSEDTRSMYEWFRAYTSSMGGSFPPLPTVH